MTTRIEQLLIASFDRENGWDKIYDNLLKIYYRSFRIGNTVSCNDDLIKDYTIKTYITAILDSHKIQYILSVIDNTNNFSYQINLDEYNYELLKSQYN